MTALLLRHNRLSAAVRLAVVAALAGCAGTPPAKRPGGDRALVEATLDAQAAFKEGRIEQAEALFKRALVRARALDQSLAIGNAAYNRAACLLRLRRYALARTLLAEARYELARADVPLADVLLLQARAAHLAGDAKAASLHVQQLRADGASRPAPRHRVQAALLEGRMACDRGDWPAASASLRRSRAAMKLQADAPLQAHVAELTGRIAMGTGKVRAAAEAFDRQSHLLRRAGWRRALAASLAQAGSAYAAMDEHKPAADRLYRAARSAAAWGEAVSAEKWARAALTAARQAGDPTMVRLVDSLLAELTPPSP